MVQKKYILAALVSAALLAVFFMMDLTMAQAAKPQPPSPTPTLPPLPAGNYYVSTTGSDANPGTYALPWQHIQVALDRVDAGSTVYVMGGVYNETVTFIRSGMAGAYISLQNYPGQAPVIDGTGIPISGETGLVVIENKAFVRLVGFEIRNLKAGGNSKAFPAGIWIRGNGSYIEIRDNWVHDIENSCKHCGAHGIAVYGRDPDTSINHLILDGNEVSNGKFGWSESLVLNGNVEKFVVSNNKVHDNDNIGIDFIGFEGENPDPAVDRARDGSVTGNLVYNIDSYPNPAYGGERSADGIYVDGGTNIIIERNTVHHTNIGIELASEHAGKDTSYITLRSNFIYANTQVGIAIGGYDTLRGSTIGCVIVNNTLFNNFTQGDWGAELYVQYDTQNNLIKNNILYANAYKRYIESWSAVMSGNVVDYNLYYAGDSSTSGTWIWKNVTYNTFLDYQQATANDVNGLAGLDPLLVSTTTPDLHLQPGSPAINRGENLAEAGSYDIDGEKRIWGKIIDLGADEVKGKTK